MQEPKFQNNGAQKLTEGAEKVRFKHVKSNYINVQFNAQYTKNVGTLIKF